MNLKDALWFISFFVVTAALLAIMGSVAVIFKILAP
jgi:hypothetical protein